AGSCILWHYSLRWLGQQRDIFQGYDERCAHEPRLVLLAEWSIAKWWSAAGRGRQLLWNDLVWRQQQLWDCVSSFDQRHANQSILLYAGQWSQPVCQSRARP